MPGRLSLRRARSVLSAEFAAMRRREPDLDAGDLVSFTLPLTLAHPPVPRRRTVD